jgi:hypothetical protein
MDALRQFGLAQAFPQTQLVQLGSDVQVGLYRFDFLRAPGIAAKDSAA